MGRPAKINQSSIVAASIEIADEHGLAGLTMKAVSERLAVTPMALYRHINRKADLLDLVVEALLTEIALQETNASWEEMLDSMGHAARKVARRYPSIFPLLLQRPANTPESKRVRDAIVSSLVAAGLGTEKARRIERLVSTMILGFAASEAGGRFASHSRKVTDEDFAYLTRLIRQTVRDTITGTTNTNPTRAKRDRG
jgi:AcrR family transcriptional regulator